METRKKEKQRWSNFSKTIESNLKRVQHLFNQKYG
jgi:hypothetical protein